MKTTLLLPVLATIIGSAYTSTAFAAERQVEGLVGGAGVHYGEDDNVFQDETLEFDSKFVELSGVFGYGVGSDTNFMEMLLEVNHRDYNESDDYELRNVDFTSIAQWQPNKSHTFELHGTHHRVEENQDQTNRDRDGSQLPNRFSAEGNEYFYSDAGLVYDIGHERNLVAAKVGVNHQWRRYLNNRRAANGTTNNTSHSSNNVLKERDVLSGNGALYYQFSPKLRLVVAGQYDDYDYIELGSNLDAENMSVVGGIEWQEGGSKAWLRAGTEEKDFDLATAAAPKDGDMGIWQAGYFGKLSDRVDVEFTSDARIIEGTDIEDYIEQIETAVKINALIFENLVVSLGYDYTDEEYVDTDCGTTLNKGCYVNRQDTVKEVSLNWHYNFVENVAVGVDFRYIERESNLANYSFDRNIVSVYLESSI